MIEKSKSLITPTELDARARHASADLLLRGGMGDSYPDITLEHLGIAELPKEGLVLNIGTGHALMLEKFANENNPDLQMISYDFQLSDRYNREDWIELQKDEELNNIFIAGLAQELPFKEETFDLIVSHASVPIYLGSDYLPNSEQHLNAFYAEVWRVLKPGAEFRAAPILDHEVEANKKLLENLGIPTENVNFEEFITTGSRTGQEVKWVRLILQKTV